MQKKNKSQNDGIKIEALEKLEKVWNEKKMMKWWSSSDLRRILMPSFPSI